jgi:hypothetical protein
VNKTTTMQGQPLLKDLTVGVTASVAAFGFTLTQFEAGVRVAASVGGLAVVVLTICKMVRDWRRGK